MKWSINKSKTFKKCQRKWYYSEIVANPRSTEGIRKETYLLKQLKSIYAWRGSLVDKVIQNYITPILLKHDIPNEKDVIDKALKLANSQIRFAKENKYRFPGITKSKVGNDYCALYDMHYKAKLDDASLKGAKDDIIVSLKNLLSSEILSDIARDNKYVVSQRTLSYHFFGGVNIVCVPDMIVFFENRQPLIIDWKVHAYGNSDAWLQLGVYSVALCNTSPHRDFPESHSNIHVEVSKIDLLEFQLLKNVQRKYTISDEDVLDIEDYMLTSINQIKNLVNGRDFNDLDKSLFQTSRNPQTCKSCQFKCLCWRNESSHKLRHIQQTLFWGITT
jgi:hypothetical protein